MSLLMNQRDAEEASREVFLEVLRDADLFQRDPDLSSRICRICVNACLARLRKDPRRKTVPIEEFLPVFTEEGAHAGPIVDWSREVGHRLPEKEFGRLIDGLTGELPEKYRVVFALCDVQGFSCEETAQLLDLEDRGGEVAPPPGETLPERAARPMPAGPEGGIRSPSVSGWLIMNDYNR